MRALLACFILGLATGAWPQSDYPNRPIRLIVTVPPGGAADFIGLLAPAATPRAVIERLNRETVRVLDAADIRERLEAQGAEPMPGTPEAFGSFIQEEMAKWAQVVKQAGVKLD